MSPKAAVTLTLDLNELDFGTRAWSAEIRLEATIAHGLVDAARNQINGMMVNIFALRSIALT